MARYIDAELLEKKVSKPSIYDINKDDVIALIADMPTADVMPREEAERWKNAMMGECMLSCCILRDEFMREAEISVAKKIFKDIQSCIGYINWDESGENILSFVVDFKKFNDFKEKYTKGGEQK